MIAHTPGEWSVHARPDGSEYGHHVTSHGLTICAVTYQLPDSNGESERIANARLIAAAPELLKALHEGRRAIGDHFAPNDCYATGPLTGDGFRDLVQCPACSFIAMYDAAIAKATGEQA